MSPSAGSSFFITVQEPSAHDYDIFRDDFKICMIVMHIFFMGNNFLMNLVNTKLNIIRV